MLKLPEWKYLKYKLQQKWEDITASRGYSSKSYKGDSFIEKLAAFRILISTHPVLKACIGALCVSLIIVTIWLSLSSGTEEPIVDTELMWFYDLNTNELFTADKTSFPPIDTESGPTPDGKPAGVIANVLTYDPTGEDESQQFIAYLETLTGEGKVAWQEALETDRLAEMDWATGRLVKRLEDKVWVKADSPEGILILNTALKPNKKGHPPQYVNPD